MLHLSNMGSATNKLTPNSSHDKHPQASGEQSDVPDRPLSDVDFETAISSLEASTAAIEKQCQNLETQKRALQQLQHRYSHNEATETAPAQRQKKLAREKAQLDFDVNELTDALQAKVQMSGKQADSAVSGLPSTVERLLEKDDRLLDGLQKLLPKLADADPNVGDVEADVDGLCQALTALSAREIRLRLDATYRAAAASSASPSHQANGHDPRTEKQREALRSELAELSHEIDGLAIMAVDNQYRLPISHALKTAAADTASDKARWSEYLAATLQYLIACLEALDSHCHSLHAHQGALTHVSAALEAALATPAATAAARKSTHSAALKPPSTPTASSKGLKPLRLVQANFSLEPPQDPTTQLLRHFDIRSTDTADTAKLASSLDHAVHDRQTALADLSNATERTLSDQLAEALRKADHEVGDLLGAVYAHSQYGRVRLVDASVQAELESLETATQRLGEEMRGLDVEAVARVVKMKQSGVLRRG